MLKAPLIYFPSTVAMVDDDGLYARMLIDRLGMPGLTYVNSYEFIEQQKQNDLIFIEDYEKHEHIDFSYLKKQLREIKNSGKLISTVIADLHMEEKSGIDLLSCISSPYIGKILISNFMDYQNNPEITNALRKGLINATLDKTKNFHEVLKETINMLKVEFFTKLSNSLFPQEIKDQHPFNEVEVAKIFIQMILDLAPSEISANSSFNKFTFIFEKSRPDMVFTISDKREIASYVETNAAELAPHKVLDSLRSGNYMLCSEDEDVLLDGEQWPLFIRPARQIIGKNTTYLYNISEVM